MRSNSGIDESRNNLRDPTLRDRERQSDATSRAKQDSRTTEQGSHARKSGQKGHGEHR